MDINFTLKHDIVTRRFFVVTLAVKSFETR